MSPLSAVTIRRGLPTDAAALATIEQACFAIPWSEIALAKDLTENRLAHYFVAIRPDGWIAGYASCWQVFDQAQINNIAVRPDDRRHGIARILLQTLIDWAVSAGLQSLDLEVRVSNQAARSLYHSAGFIEAGLRRRYYADNGEDAIIMLKNIDNLDTKTM
jgi:ribosomal-protein-alanine N-acetyltransferase